jgi:hypothetical protein
MKNPRCPMVVTMMAVTGLMGFATQDAGIGRYEAQPSKSNSITVNGCLRSTDQMMVGTSGRAGTEPRSANDSSIKFVLTGAAPADRTKSDTPATAYRLDADENALSSHAGHRVEIVGKIENPGSTSPRSDSVFSSAPRLKVVSVKSLGSSCAP